MKEPKYKNILESSFEKNAILWYRLGVVPLLDVQPKCKNGNSLIPELAHNYKIKCSMERCILKWNDKIWIEMKLYLWCEWKNFFSNMIETDLWSKTMVCKYEMSFYENVINVFGLKPARSRDIIVLRMYF